MWYMQKLILSSSLESYHCTYKHIIIIMDYTKSLLLQLEKVQRIEVNLFSIND